MNKDYIITKLEEIEKQKNITILYACESGSRAWNMHSQTSDFDVRFIYKRDINWYLQLYEGQDVLEWKTTDKLEFVGWDLKKSLKLLYKSNPTLLEWLNSPYVYKRDALFAEEMKKHAQMFFSPFSVLHHYLSMAKKNNHALHQSGKINTKTYLNVIKPIVCSLWILNAHEFPCIGDKILFERYLKDRNVLIEVDRLIRQKRNGDNDFSSPVLDYFIKVTLENIKDQLNHNLKPEKIDIKGLNDFFIKTIQS